MIYYYKIVEIESIFTNRQQYYIMNNILQILFKYYEIEITDNIIPSIKSYIDNIIIDDNDMSLLNDIIMLFDTKK